MASAKLLAVLASVLACGTGAVRFSGEKAVALNAEGASEASIMSLAEQWFTAAMGKAAEMQEKVFMVVADNNVKTLAAKSVDGTMELYKSLAEGKAKFLHNGGSDPCQTTACAVHPLLSFQTGWREDFPVVGAKYVHYTDSAAGNVTGFFSVSGCISPANDALINCAGLTALQAQGKMAPCKDGASILAGEGQCPEHWCASA